jgi:hypothetical protein
VTGPTPPLLTPAAGGELRAAVGRIAARLAGPGATVGPVTIRPGAYASSHLVAEVRVAVGRRRYRMLVKDVGPRSATAPVRGVAPRFVTDPDREVRVYTDVLARAELGTPRFLGSASGRGRRWLVLEFIPGRPLAEVGSLGVWEQAAAWVARFHTRFPARRVPRSVLPSLTRVDGGWLTRWASRAVRFVRGAAPADRVRVLRRVAREYDRVADGVLAWPAALIHGDYFPANILVARDARAGGRVCPVDWESAAVGPGLLDLAAVTAGGWTEGERSNLAAAYYDALPRRDRPNPLAFREAFRWCRLHLAVQRLGWAAGWSPPAHQAHDWLDDVVRLADRFGL